MKASVRMKEYAAPERRILMCAAAGIKEIKQGHVIQVAVGEIGIQTVAWLKLANIRKKMHTCAATLTIAIGVVWAAVRLATEIMIIKIMSMRTEDLPVKMKEIFLSANRELPIPMNINVSAIEFINMYPPILFLSPRVVFCLAPHRRCRREVFRQY
jgi:hypothetical protein